MQRSHSERSSGDRRDRGRGSRRGARPPGLRLRRERRNAAVVRLTRVRSPRRHHLKAVVEPHGDHEGRPRIIWRSPSERGGPTIVVGDLLKVRNPCRRTPGDVQAASRCASPTHLKISADHRRSRSSFGGGRGTCAAACPTTPQPDTTHATTDELSSALASAKRRHEECSRRRYYLSDRIEIRVLVARPGNAPFNAAVHLRDPRSG